MFNSANVGVSAAKATLESVGALLIPVGADEPEPPVNCSSIPLANLLARISTNQSLTLKPSSVNNCLEILTTFDVKV